ncbi:MAG: bifunctional proline dehydrogenase/L-glutamate gamma-semialdehyde dehydrogenase PutA [Legionellales bacterium]|nr:bifunctional proline dehydrogenase/L-glutamate gamma-semialdehyde dehydrogenase PutA [Legionellales bacterium]
MLENRQLIVPQGLRAQIDHAYRAPEHQMVQDLLKAAQLDPKLNGAIRNAAISLVEAVRAGRKKNVGIDSFLTEYSLSSEEGIALMCLAEALLRVPDDPTINGLIKDKISSVDWKSHQGQSDSFFINATTWALMLTGSVLAPEKASTRLNQAVMTVLNRSGEGVVRVAVEKGMRIMSKQFVMGRTIKEALKRAKKKEAQGYRYSYDMLGEAALTHHDAERYFNAYAAAIEAIGAEAKDIGNMVAKPGISIKLSALHPRYQEAHRERVLEELGPKLLALSQMAKKHSITLTIDAEESERLELSMDVIESVFSDPSLAGWNGFGLAVQSYQKRAFYLLDWLADLARRNHRRIMVRLIKGAYWDSEIKKTQMQGLSDYPVFTRKVFTDLSFQACAKKILTMTDVIYPQFATHNAYSVALIMSLVGDYRDFEFQCLHGMGTELYEQVVPENCYNIPCRIYAPVGSHEDLLPYLVRRLLENGANSSFVNRIVDESAPIAELVQDSVQKSADLLSKINQNIPLPANIFLPDRSNSMGIDLSSRSVRASLQADLAALEPWNWQASPVIGSQTLQTGTLSPVESPQIKQAVGQYLVATSEDLELALIEAERAFATWSKTSVAERSICLLKFADLLEENMTQCLAILCMEAGKTWSDAIGEVREAVDFCRYYAAQATKLLSQPTHLRGYTGETNTLTLHPRGTILCISPWNFPLAIFTGQIVAALITGNCVIAKPAEQTPLIAFHAIQWMREAGFPAGVIQLVTGSGSKVGAALVADKRIKGVIFTGSTQTANRIHQTLAAREEIIPLIAETGGQNAMIVDSSALLEQVTIDVMNSAFGSAGQRCSAMRVLFVQEDVYPRMKELLQGAMSELCIGDPRWLTTDVGPVIDEDALAGLQAHVATLSQTHEIIYQCTLPQACSAGYYMPPTAIAIEHISVLEKEVFGPVLHVIRYKRDQLDDVITQINQTGYGLTLGIHSRLNSTVDYIRERVHVGNCYVNRNMIGAVVGLQPFGGEGLSGTGPKAGGPYYLQRMCVERTVTVDTTAAGGNASLMSIPD